MKYLGALIIMFAWNIPIAVAHIPEVVTQMTLRDVVAIENPEISRAFYGQMDGFPHTYEIRSETPFHLFVQVLVPNQPSSKNIVSGIIIHEVGKSGRVEEVSRLLAKDALWDSFYEPFGGDYYRKGGMFEKDVPAGVYRIEVSTPDNLDRYILVVGKIEDTSGIGYFEMIGRIADVKAFLGKTRIMVIESPLVYIPMGILLIIGAFMWYRHKRLQATVKL